MRKAINRDTITTLRTRAHIIADLSVHHVEGIVLWKGYTVEVFRKDYGYDLGLFTYNYRDSHDEGEFETEDIKLQLKATDSLTVIDGGKTIAFPGIRRHHINLWINTVMPVFLIVYDAVEEIAYWLDIQEYARAGALAMETYQQTVTVRIPKANVLDEAAIEMFRRKKLERYAILMARRREN